MTNHSRTYGRRLSGELLSISRLNKRQPTKILFQDFPARAQTIRSLLAAAYCGSASMFVPLTTHGSVPNIGLHDFFRPICCGVAFLRQISSKGVLKVPEQVALRRTESYADPVWFDIERSEQNCQSVR